MAMSSRQPFLKSNVGINKCGKSHREKVFSRERKARYSIIDFGLHQGLIPIANLQNTNKNKNKEN